MNSSLGKLTSKIHPTFLRTLQRIYLIRAKVVSNKNLEEQKIDSVFDNVNIYSDGRGISVTKKFDELFNLHKDLPSAQYELLNTSFIDSLHISSYVEVILGDLNI